MPSHKVELRTYLRILTCTAVGGVYMAIGVVWLVLFANPDIEATPDVLAHLLFYLVPAYGAAATLGFSLLAYVLQPFLLRPMARRMLDPLLVSWVLLLDLLILACLYWINTNELEFLLSPRQLAHLERAALGLTVAFALAMTAHASQYLYPTRRRIARAALLALALSTLYFLHEQRTPTFRAPRRHTLVLDVAASRTPMRILAIDGLSLDHLRPMEAAGKLPNLGRLLSEGTSAPLRTLRPTEPSVIWTTVATGKLPFRHGVSDPLRFGFSGLFERLRVTPRYLLFRSLAPLGVLRASPVLRGDRLALPFWSVLSRTGGAVGVVNWPVTYPAEPVRGFMVTDYLVKPYFQFGKGLAGVIHPERLSLLASRSRVSPEDVPDLLLLPPSATGDAPRPEDARRRLILRSARARDLTARRCALMFAAHHRPEVLVLRLDGLDTVLRYFLRFHDPEAYGDVSPDEAKRYGRVVETYYGFLDAIVGEQMRALPPDGLLVVVSAASVGPAPWIQRLVRPWRDPLLSASRASGPDGAIVMWGRAIERGKALSPKRLVDVAPTILYAQGLPITRDMDGTPLFDAFTEEVKSRTPVSIIASYEAAHIGRGRRLVPLSAKPPPASEF